MYIGLRFRLPYANGAACKDWAPPQSKMIENPGVAVKDRPTRPAAS